MNLFKITPSLLLLCLFSFTSEAASTDHFVTTWKTDNPGTSSNDTSIAIFTKSSYTYLYDVDWDNDGVFDEFGITGSVTHDFGTAGIKTIRIKGIFPTIRLGNDSKKIISIDQWGNNQWSDMAAAFSGAVNLVNKAMDTPNLSHCQSLNQMFVNASNIGAASETANWQWNTSNIVTMRRMFDGATSFNQDVGGWNTVNVNNMSQMFKGAVSFDQDLGGWNLASMYSIGGMFSGAKLSTVNYESLLIGWGAQALPNNLFFDAGGSDYCAIAAQAAHDKMTSLFNWTISDGGSCAANLNIVTSTFTVDENSSIILKIEYTDPNYDIATFALTGGDDDGLFTLDSITGELSFNIPPDYENPLDADGDNVYRVEVTVTDDGIPVETDSQLIKIYVYNLNENLASEHFVSTWDSDNITISIDGNYSYNFNVDWNNDGIFDDLNVNGEITHNYGVGGLKTIRVSGEFPYLLLRRKELISIDQWGSNPWQDMEEMFSGATNVVVKAQDVPNLFHCKTLIEMFSNAKLVGGSTDTGNWSWLTQNIASMSGMFKNATSFNKDISSWDTSSVYDISAMFYNAVSFDQKLGAWNVENVSNLRAFLYDVDLSVDNYDDLLTGWGTQNLIMGRDFDAGGSIYCSSVAQASHQNIESVFKWTIYDGGVCDVGLNIITKSLVVDENIIQPVKIKYTDPDFNTATFSLTGGDDMGLFNLNSTSGVISFLNPPNYENPLDADGDNVYLVEITATDNGSPIESDTQLIKIYVNNINEGLASEDFVATWNASYIAIRTCYALSYDYKVDWDNDGVFDEFNITGDISHQFSTGGGEHTIRVSGSFPCLREANMNSIDQWGSTPWEYVYRMFAYQGTAVLKAQDTPNLFKLKSLYGMFIDSKSIGGITDTGNWNWKTPTITNMEQMFSGASSFNKMIGNWDTSRVRYFSELFWRTSSFNQDISTWDTSSALKMDGIFAGLVSFNQDISNWDTSKVINMELMFSGASSFNHDIGNWDVNRVIDMRHIFSGAESFNQDIGGWVTSSVTDMSSMFFGASLFNQDIGNWDVSSVIEMDFMFFNAKDFDQDLGDWNVENVNSFSNMFTGVMLSVTNYDNLLVGWSTKNLIMNNVFGGGKSIYCSSAAQLARNNISSNYNWSISDGGVCAGFLNIVSENFAIVDENQTQVMKVKYTDPDFNIASFTITDGEDKALFSIDSLSGNLTFKNPPNYEIPNDSNGDNVYLVRVTVTDNGIPVESSSQLIKVYINNIDENLASEDFVSTWNNPSRIITNALYNYDYDVDWENDGVFDDFGVKGDISHNYGVSGEQTIRISGVFPTLKLNSTNESKLMSVDQWGNIKWRKMYQAFDDAENLVIKAQDVPNLFYCNSLSYMFYGSPLVGSYNGTVNWNWKTPTITSMRGTFAADPFGGENLFNKDISSWDTSNVQEMNGMFSGATSFNQDISNWDTSNVQEMNGMFSGATSFNQDIGGWNTSRVTNMAGIFSQAISFNQNIGEWDVDNVSNFNGMFDNARLSVANYDALLVGWNAQNLSMSRSFDGGDSIYCSSAAQIAHNNMTSFLNWTISDGGVCAPQLNIVSSNQASVDENHTTIIKVLTTDPDFDTPTFSISGGVDGALFSINASSGLLSFINPPDFENPQSASNSNDYEVEVSVLDDGIPQEFASQLLTVSVNDLVETSPVDLSIDAIINTQYINLGDTVVFTVNVVNNGPQDAVDAIFYDVLPAEFDSSTWTCVATGLATCTASGTGEIADFISVPNDGGTLTYTITATLSASQPVSTSYKVMVESSEPQYDTNLLNNRDDVSINYLIFIDGFE